jgi:hypothetical protein
VSTLEDDLLAVYIRVDEQLNAGRFADVERDLAAVDVATLPVVLLLAWLSITHAAKEHLPGRDAFADAVKTRLEREDPERAEDLLRGLL